MDNLFSFTAVGRQAGNVSRVVDDDEQRDPMKKESDVVVGNTEVATHTRRKNKKKWVQLPLDNVTLNCHVGKQPRTWLQSMSAVDVLSNAWKDRKGSDLFKEKEVHVTKSDPLPAPSNNSAAVYFDHVRQQREEDKMLDMAVQESLRTAHKEQTQRRFLLTSAEDFNESGQLSDVECVKHNVGVSQDTGERNQSEESKCDCENPDFVVKRKVFNSRPVRQNSQSLGKYRTKDNYTEHFVGFEIPSMEFGAVKKSYAVEKTCIRKTNSYQRSNTAGYSNKAYNTNSNSGCSVKKANSEETANCNKKILLRVNSTESVTPIQQEICLATVKVDEKSEKPGDEGISSDPSNRKPPKKARSRKKVVTFSSDVAMSQVVVHDTRVDNCVSIDPNNNGDDAKESSLNAIGQVETICEKNLVDGLQKGQVPVLSYTSVSFESQVSVNPNYNEIHNSANEENSISNESYENCNIPCGVRDNPRENQSSPEEYQSEFKEIVRTFLKAKENEIIDFLMSQFLSQKMTLDPSPDQANQNPLLSSEFTGMVQQALSASAPPFWPRGQSTCLPGNEFGYSPYMDQSVPPPFVYHEENTSNHDSQMNGLIQFLHDKIIDCPNLKESLMNEKKLPGNVDETYNSQMDSVPGSGASQARQPPMSFQGNLHQQSHPPTEPGATQGSAEMSKPLDVPSTPPTGHQYPFVPPAMLPPYGVQLMSPPPSSVPNLFSHPPPPIGQPLNAQTQIPLASAHLGAYQNQQAHLHEYIMRQNQPWLYAQPNKDVNANQENPFKEFAQNIGGQVEPSGYNCCVAPTQDASQIDHYQNQVKDTSAMMNGSGHGRVGDVMTAQWSPNVERAHSYGGPFLAQGPNGPIMPIQLPGFRNDPRQNQQDFTTRGRGRLKL